MPAIGLIENEALETMTSCMGCRDHVDAARAGHLHCLGDLCEKGLFLSLDSPDWATAGEARKSQAFEAAIAGCSSGHAGILAWIFSSGWPPDLQAMPFVLEYKLYCCAVQQPTPSCLEALLDAGCRSAWISHIAAREGKADVLALAAKRGCPYNFPEVSDCAASSGDHAVLERVLASDHVMHYLAGWLFGGTLMGSLTSLAASNGHWECLELLKRAGCMEWSPAAQSAARSGRLQILQNLVCLDPSLVQKSNLLSHAAKGGSLACLDFLERAGCTWDPCVAAGQQSPGKRSSATASNGVVTTFREVTSSEPWMRQSLPQALTACRLCMTMGTSLQAQGVITTRLSLQSNSTVWRAYILHYNSAVHHSGRGTT
eukprot:jgi/Botrbrau1/19203/Bobra.0077s0106.1